MQRIPQTPEIADLIDERTAPKKSERVTFACVPAVKDFFRAASEILGEENFAEAVRRGALAYVTAAIDEKRRRETRSSLTAGAKASLPTTEES